MNRTAFPGAALAWLIWDTIIHIEIEVNESLLRVQYQVHIASLLSGSLHMEVNTPWIAPGTLITYSLKTPEVLGEARLLFYQICDDTPRRVSMYLYL